ncbi:mannose-1-phosphate guanylyltransferase [Paenibacillus chondroitinus]|uniref:Mannose-1-phosphate guanylyltransferase n=1 Tax=Paenibacillus chondroitinus TaxID=59842 RepID=A0ABU6DAX1_9BACL|nr:MULTISPECIES: mannose-1-phosphate guanylyltransferase [Paenibacillus]MCY9657475.1 sugar phosphate nucleotidyltransferase [Paenibacillus anseongense]MEB4794905.1 mannose-1-phosphate guanylyltransferase [Paenibacillus chondroitinus]
MKRFSVIMAGGGGTRFWPLSRQNKPKQLLNISGNDIMINDTILRYEKVISIENTIIVTNKSQASLLEDILLEEVPRRNILKEPLGKNTAACILYAALFLQKKYDDCVMIVLPSDHHITNVNSFKSVLEKASQLAEQEDNLVTIGIKPTFPSTGYGYINFNKSILNNGAYEVKEFVEKPSFDKANQYLSSGEYLWNSGMFLWKTSKIIACFQRYLPRLYNNMMQIYADIGTQNEEQAIAEIYPNLQNISIDYGILERSDDVIVIPGDFGWNDVGSWDALGGIFSPDDKGNIVKAKHIGLETKNSIIFGNDRLIATIGINNLIIAETRDAILVCPKDRAQDVKNIVDMLKEKGMSDYV